MTCTLLGNSAGIAFSTTRKTASSCEKTVHKHIKNADPTAWCDWTAFSGSVSPTYNAAGFLAQGSIVYSSFSGGGGRID
jgi:hypothetical protein